MPTPEAFSRLNLYTVLHNVPDGITLANADGRIVFSNHAGDEILGVTAATEASPDDWAEHYGVFLPDGQTPFPTERYPLVRALKGETTRDVEMLVRNPSRPDGVLISASGRRLFDTDGTPIGAVVVFRDITELREAQDALERAIDDLEATQHLKDEILSFVVHDLKSPLTAIAGTADLILAEAPPDAAVAEDARTIKEATRRVNRLVVDMLDIQLAEDGALELELSHISVPDLLEQAIHRVRPRLGRNPERLHVGGARGLRLRADRSLLLRLIDNLVDNCLKYGPLDGRIWVEVTPADTDTILLSVRDEGPGVPEHLRRRIFEKYAQVERDERGRTIDSRGLGLRFCKVVADTHGGRIWVEDAEPVGARFCVELPV